MAARPSEKKKLKARYQAMLKACESRGADQVATEFIAACDKSMATVRYSFQRFQRFVLGDTELFESYHDLERLRLRASLSSPINFEEVRPQAETALLGNAKHIQEIHYGCLTLDGVGLDNYGECIAQLSPSKSAHRVSCFEGNSAVLFARSEFRECLRSVWKDRSKICLAVFGDRLNSSTSAADFPSIIVQHGRTAMEDTFIEVQLFGPVTVRTLESVRFETKNMTEIERAQLEAIQEKLGAAGVKNAKI